MNGEILANKSSKDRPSTDFYPTPPEVTKALLEFLKIPTDKTLWECACGRGHMTKVMEEFGYKVISTDLNDFGFGETGIDFTNAETRECQWIITNPPFIELEAFIRQCIKFGIPFAMLLKSQYWHSKKRLALFQEYKPRYVLPLTWRPDFLFGEKGGAPTMECIWTVWDKEPAEITEYIPLKRYNS